MGFCCCPATASGISAVINDPYWRSLTSEDRSIGPAVPRARPHFGLEADGTIKSCPSLPKSHFAAGETRLMSRSTTPCAISKAARSGATAIAAAAFAARVITGAPAAAVAPGYRTCWKAKRGDNPYCYYRATTLAKRGLRERTREGRGSAGRAVRGRPLRGNPFADVGKGPGGSVVPLAKCTIVGTARNDRIKGTKGNDVICGLGGNDRISGNGGNDVIDTANGNDLASGNTGKDTLIGVRGKDRHERQQRQRPRRRRRLGRPADAVPRAATASTAARATTA